MDAQLGLQRPNRAPPSGNSKTHQNRSVHACIHGGTIVAYYQIKFRQWGQTSLLFVCTITYHVT